MLDVIENRQVCELTEEIDLHNCAPGFRRLISDLLAEFEQCAGEELTEPPQNYSLPGRDWFSQYLTCLEQLLAVRSALHAAEPAKFLHGERNIIDGNIANCLQFPQCLPARILLAETVIAMNRVRPDVVVEYQSKLERLFTEFPLADSTANEMLQTVMQRNK